MEKKSCRLLRLSSFTDQRGKLTVIEGGETVPFEIRRIFFLHGLAPDAVRGNHATLNDQCFVLLAGSCRVQTHDGEKETVFLLDEPMSCVYVPSMIWRGIYDCSENTVLAVLSDKHYDPDDYVRDFDVFLKLRAAEKDEKDSGEH